MSDFDRELKKEAGGEEDTEEKGTKEEGKEEEEEEEEEDEEGGETMGETARGRPQPFNSLQDDKIFDWSRLKQIADDVLKCIENEK